MQNPTSPIEGTPAGYLTPEELAVDSLDALSDELSQTIQLTVSWDGDTPAVRVLGQDGAQEFPSEGVRVPALGGDIQIDGKTLERAVQAQLSAQLGAYVDFDPSQSGGVAISPLTVNIPAEDAKGATYLLEGTTDYHRSSGGRLIRDKVCETLTPGSDGMLSMALLPGSYVLRQIASPEGCLVNEREMPLSVGTQGFSLDGKSGAEHTGLVVTRAARRYRAMLRDEDGTPMASARWLIEGYADGAGPYSTSVTADAHGFVRFSLPIGRFMLERDEPPFEPVMSFEVTEPSSGVDALDVSIDAPKSAPDGSASFNSR